MLKISGHEIHALILDMDGVIWRGDFPIGDLPSIFDTINQKNLKVILATNNASLTVRQYLDKLLRLGVVLEEWQVITSAQATAHYLRQMYPEAGSVFVVGETGLHQALKEVGFTHSDTKNVAAVVVGLDRKFTYEKLSKATTLIRSGAAFVGTNPDRTYPEKHELVPGTGSILSFLEAASDIAPTVIGKPAPEMYRIALNRLGLPAENALVIGDHIETDIAGAQALGCPCALVLTGVTSQKAADQWVPAADIITSDLTNLVEML